MAPTRLRRRDYRSLSVVVAMALAGCGAEVGTPPAVGVALEVRTPDGDTGGVRLVSATVVVRALRLDGTDGTSDAGNRGALVVDMALTREQRAPALAVAVPPGLYDRLELEIGPLDDVDDPHEEILLEARPALRETSLVIGLEVEGTPLALGVDLRRAVEADLTPPLVVSGQAADSLTVVLDARGWLGTGDRVLDPRDPRDREEIRGNIAASLRIERSD